MPVTERNPKVRRRLAAGKLRLRICDLRNLGPKSEQVLASIGIHSAEELRRRGALDAFLALRRAGLGRSLNLLWALVGALEPWPEGRDWREVAVSEERLPLLLAVEMRDTARRAVLEAGDVATGTAGAGSTGAGSTGAGSTGAGSPGARGSGLRRGRRPSSPSKEPAGEDVPPWVPGMPFETKKNRR
jgi:DNA transformation protein